MTTTAPFKPLTKDAVADLLGVSIRTVENWVNDGTLPSPSKLGARVYWHPTSFYAWLDKTLSHATAASVPQEQGVTPSGQPADEAPAASPERPNRQTTRRGAGRPNSIARMRSKDDSVLQALNA